MSALNIDYNESKLINYINPVERMLEKFDNTADIVSSSKVSILFNLSSLSREHIEILVRYFWSTLS